MASYNGADLGFIFEMSTSANPKARQINSYPGANGFQVIDQGSRGGTTDVLGAILAGTPYALGAAERQFTALQLAGSPGVLVDNLGYTWGGVILVAFTPKGPTRQFVGAAGAGFAKRYEAEFLHIS